MAPRNGARKRGRGPRVEEPDAFLLRAQADFAAGVQVNVQEVLSHLSSMRLAATTRAQYDRWLDKFEHWRTQSGGSPALTAPEPNEVAYYTAILYLGSQGGQAAMARAAIASRYGRIADDKFLTSISKGIEAQWRLSGGGRTARDALPIEVIRAFALTPPAGADLFRWARDRLLVLLAVRTMRRPAELLALQTSDFELGHDKAKPDWLWLRFAKAKNDRLGKVGKRFWLPIDPASQFGLDCVHAHSMWVLLRGMLDGPIFVHADGNWVGKDHLNKLAKSLAERAGLKGIYSGYSFRIAGASFAAAGGISTTEIQAIGGWRSDAVHAYIRSLGSAAAGASQRMGL